MVHRSLVCLLLLVSPGTWPPPLVRAGEPPPVADKDVKSYVNQRVKDWQPTAEEKRFDEIGWCTSLLQAEELAKKHGRPIFLFTHDGKMQVGRC
ncbi:MAG TPA: hypothetical protein VKE94_17215 [Gemmataceae bacterium]|nr:hypothetical protein [Gemmataceae bacterium]